ncbi:hypothetical protein BJX63DRAFT_386980 [Aspergillus granulosus]|uniref:Uncharacterized protein n=1 Tax=Aspergillus granulosus TaxID=176169 RepID=A0ABR4HQG9_9EURO
MGSNRCWNRATSIGEDSHSRREDINVILRPWRPDGLRKRAWEIWRGRNQCPPVMLQTFYDNDEKGHVKFTEYTEISENFEEEASWAALNNAELFNFGSDWRYIFNILPEIVGCRNDNQRGPIQGIIDECLP